MSAPGEGAFAGHVAAEVPLEGHDLQRFDPPKECHRSYKDLTSYM